QRSFVCLVAAGEIHRNVEEWRLYGMLKRLAADALKETPEPLVALWERIPPAGKAVNSRSGLEIDFGAETDFVALSGSIPWLTVLDNSTPFFLTGFLEAWAEHRPEEATEYMIAKGVEASVSQQWWTLYRTATEA